MVKYRLYTMYSVAALFNCVCRKQASFYAREDINILMNVMARAVTVVKVEKKGVFCVLDLSKLINNDKVKFGSNNDIEIDISKCYIALMYLS